MELTLIGIGSGNPDHLTGQAIHALKQADLVVIPRKSNERQELAQLRQELCQRYLPAGKAAIRCFDMPERDPGNPDYRLRVEAWHDAIADLWDENIGPDHRHVVLLIWGDPSLFDSSLRIAERLQARRAITVKVVPGLTSLQLLTAAHAIPLNDLGQPVLITTGRQLRAKGWPGDLSCVAVMLDGDCAFQCLDAGQYDIWWGAYLGMEGEILINGPLTSAGPRILTARASARAARGWIMDIYLLRRRAEAPGA